MHKIFHGTWRQIVGYFLAGLFAVLPLVITVAIVAWVAGIVHDVIGPGSAVGGQLRGLGLRFATNTTMAYLIGWVLVLAAIFALGVFVRMGARRLIYQLTDALLKRVPLVGSIYNTARQLVDMLDKGNKTDLKGMRVVYCEFGAAAGSGILALMPTPDQYEFNGRDYHVVYIPTSPLPMTGGLIFVPVDSVHRVDMSVDGLMSIYLSMGVTGPQFLTDHRPAGDAAEKS